MTTSSRNGAKPQEAPVNAPSASDIVGKVNKLELATTELRDRMEEDYKLYRLESEEADEGYRNYFSNEPQTFAKKVISILIDSDLLIRFPIHGKGKPNRARDDLKERFILGCLKSADQYLKDQVLPLLKDQLAFFVTLRGMVCGRVMLIKESEELTRVEIMPWDPRHTYYGVGPKGITWACYKMSKTREEIEEEFGHDVDFSGTSSTLDRENSGIDLYDYYDRNINCLVMGSQYLKEPWNHGVGVPPVFIGVAGASPPIRSLLAGSTIKDFGESIYQSVRDIYPRFNKTMATMYTLVGRSAKVPVVVESPDGQKKLELDIWAEGSEIDTRTGDKIIPLDLLNMAKDTGAFLGQVAGELQRGSFSHTVYGDLQFQLSGFAINTLRLGMGSTLQPSATAIENGYGQIARLLCRQIATGHYADLTLDGYTYSGEYFEETYQSDNFVGNESPEITLKLKLPQDEAQKFALAEMARRGPNPMLPDVEIWDKMLGYQNVDDIKAGLREQMAESATPVAMLYSMVQDLNSRGRDDLAYIYWIELMKLVSSATPTPAQPPSPGSPASPIGTDPRLLPNAMAGKPPPTPLPQGTLLPTAPQTPRPGAGSSPMDERLARIGLFPP